MSVEKLKIFKDKKDKYHFKTKDDRHIDIEYKDKHLKFRLNKWNKEASVEVVLDLIEADTHTFSGNKIEVEDSSKKVRVYPIDVHSGDGGLRFELVYKEKPPTYSFTVPIVSKKLRWSKQPFLTQADRDAGRFCPEKVEGSIAVYHINKKNNKYMTGKAFHVYRPIAIDAEGNKTWCEIDADKHIDPTSLTVTTPQQFMDEATYPVTVDPDFGYLAIGLLQAAIGSTAGSNRAGSAWTMPATGTANYMRAYLQGAGPVKTPNVKAFINQKDSGGAGTHGQIATVENLNDGWAPHWEEFTLASELLTVGIDYILSVLSVGDLPTGIFYVMYDVNGAVDSYYEAQTYGAPESPWIVNPEGTTNDYSIFVNYTLAGWTGKISGVVNPAEIAGVDKADIAAVKGVA